MTCHLVICRGKKSAREEKLRERRRICKIFKKKSNQNSKTVALLASLPLPPSLIVPVLSRFDFSKATTSLSFFLSHLSRSGVAQPSSFLSPRFVSLPAALQIRWGPYFFIGTFYPDDCPSGRIFTNNFRKHVFGQLSPKSFASFWLLSHPSFLFPFNFA